VVLALPLVPNSRSGIMDKSAYWYKNNFASGFNQAPDILFCYNAVKEITGQMSVFLIWKSPLDIK
jgi:hypothetical protein